MTEGGEGTRAPRDLRPADQRIRELGLRLAQRLTAILRAGRAYQVGNAVFRQQTEVFHQVASEILAESEEIVFVSLGTDLYLNGFRLPIRANNVRFQEAVIREFRRRRIAGFRIERDVRTLEIEKFFEFFMQPEEFFGPRLLEACLGAGNDRMLPAIHATTEEHASDFLEGAPEVAEEPEPESWSRPSAPRAEEGAPAPKGMVRKSYRAALMGARSLLAPTSLSSGLELKQARRVIQPLVDGAFSEEPVVVGLTSLGHHDDFTYAHAVNVCSVSVTMGHMLGLDRRTLADLGVAALLHDVGKHAVADLIHRPYDEFTESEKAAAERHPVEGAKLIARSTALNPSTLRSIRVALEHHMQPRGGGYPAPAPGWKPSLLSRIVAVADCYVCLQTYRSKHGANVTPHQALGMVLGPLRESFDPVMLWALVQAVGLFPPGQVVELDNGYLALVLAPNGEDFERPHVRVIARTDAHALGPEDAVEYRPVPDTICVKRALRSEEYPEEPEARAA